MQVLRKDTNKTIYTGSFDQCRSFIKGFDVGCGVYVDLRMLDERGKEIDYHALEKKESTSKMRVLKPVVTAKMPSAITAQYKGDNGTYCSVVPRLITQAWIAALCERAQWMGFTATGPLDQHVTVVHSKKSLTVPQQNQIPMAGYSADAEFIAQPHKFTHWAGHDGDGFVVLELNSPKLSALNSWMRKTFDLPVSFDEYRAHVTIATDAYSNSVEYAQQLCEELEKIELILPHLEFTGLRVEDLSK